ncbi:MAG TPA: hypothetical protein VLA83_10495, partial [Candidatus Binatia bacterium]|nr:hypothetical protein [Candidatus Binatia bacterium]
MTSPDLHHLWDRGPKKILFFVLPNMICHRLVRVKVLDSIRIIHPQTLIIRGSISALARIAVESEFGVGLEHNLKPPPQQGIILFMATTA